MGGGWISGGYSFISGSWDVDGFVIMLLLPGRDFGSAAGKSLRRDLIPVSRSTPEGLRLLVEHEHVALVKGQRLAQTSCIQFRVCQILLTDCYSDLAFGCHFLLSSITCKKTNSFIQL